MNITLTASVLVHATGSTTSATYSTSSNPISFPVNYITFDFSPRASLTESDGSFDRESHAQSAWIGEIDANVYGRPHGWVTVRYVWPVVREWTHVFDFFDRTITLTFTPPEDAAAAKSSTTSDDEGQQA